MRRLIVVALALAAGLAPGAAVASPELQLGAYFGPRLYSDDSRLGFIEGAPAHPMLDNAVQLGGRVAYPLLPWLVPELELSIAPTGTKALAGAAATDVFWMEPRLHVRIEPRSWARLSPFVVLGGGSPIALSSARMTFDSDIQWEVYAGGGARFDSHHGFTLRLDARVSVLPGALNYLAVEGDVSIGVEFQLGKKPRAAGPEIVKVTDKDHDGIPDAKDACPTRAEDKDGFADEDGCPDIDNDGDEVLDIADRCAAEAETYNGFADDDGCPDTLPPEVDALRGTVEGLLYAEGETGVHDSAVKSLQNIAAVMAKYPSIRVQLIGHTDDREAKQFAETVEGQPAPDLEALSEDLSRARAEAARQALAAQGVAESRIEVQGAGAEDPVADNDTPKHRLANRRVEIKLYVPPR
jgi:OOP family OmpA-OmpF porin